jgi:hypothetical protein
MLPEFPLDVTFKKSIQNGEEEPDVYLFRFNALGKVSESPVNAASPDRSRREEVGAPRIAAIQVKASGKPQELLFGIFLDKGH